MACLVILPFCFYVDGSKPAPLRIQTKLKLYIDSGTHVDTDLDDRIDLIEERLGEPDHVFYEGDSSAFSQQAFVPVLRIGVYAPLLALAIIIHIYFFIELFGRVLSYLSGESAGRDDEVVRVLKRKFDIDSSEVDLGILSFVWDRRFVLAVVNWIGLAGIFAATWSELGVLSNIYHFLLYSALAGYILFYLVLAVTLPVRDLHIAEVISESKEEFSHACLVVGEAHHAEVGRMLDKESGIDVLNPIPENLSLMTRIILPVFGFILWFRSHWVSFKKRFL